jgi:hypothetical protein
MSNAEPGMPESMQLDPTEYVAPPPLELHAYVAHMVSHELRLHGASVQEINDVGTTTQAYVDMEWARLGLYSLATTTPLAFEHHVRTYCLRVWLMRLGQSRLSQVDPEGDLGVGRERSPRARLLRRIDCVELPKRCRLLLELALVWGFNQIQAAAALGISEVDAVLDMREALIVLSELSD